MANMSKASVNARYDKIRQMIKDGKISAKEAAKLGRAMSKDYHSKGNAAQRKKDATPKPPVAKKPTAKPPASKPPVKSSGPKPVKRSGPKPPNISTKATKPSTSHNIMSSSSTYTGTNRDKVPSTNHNIMSSSGRYTGDNLKVKPKSKPKARGVDVKGRTAPSKPSSTRKKYNRRGRPIK